MVALCRRRLLRAGRQARARHACDHAELGTGDSRRRQCRCAAPRAWPSGGSPVQRRTMTDAEAIDIYTDGACKGNPGAGGWGVLLKSGPHTREIYGGEPCTTNNRMELIAVIRALEALR